MHCCSAPYTVQCLECKVIACGLGWDSLDKGHPKIRVVARLDPSYPLFPPTNQFSTDVNKIKYLFLPSIRYSSNRHPIWRRLTKAWNAQGQNLLRVNTTYVFGVLPFTFWKLLKLTKYEAITVHRYDISSTFSTVMMTVTSLYILWNRCSHPKRCLLLLKLSYTIFHCRWMLLEIKLSIWSIHHDL